MKRLAWWIRDIVEDIVSLTRVRRAQKRSFEDGYDFGYRAALRDVRQIRNVARSDTDHRQPYPNE